jgi:NADH-quinone oxidoreductase subunit J
VVAQNIAFGIIAFVVVVATVRVVTTNNVVHAALYLVGVLAGIGALYILLLAEFVATTQYLVYIGAIVVLFLFGIMLTRAPIGRTLHLTGATWPVGLAVAALLAGVMTYAIIDFFGDDKLPEDATLFRTDDVGDSIFSQFIIPFEAVSVLLLAGLIGAIVLARRD